LPSKIAFFATKFKFWLKNSESQYNNKQEMSKHKKVGHEGLFIGCVSAQFEGSGKAPENYTWQPQGSPCFTGKSTQLA